MTDVIQFSLARSCNKFQTGKTLISAPGTYIHGLKNTGGVSNGFYGTSLAAPHVTGVASLLWSCMPSAWSDTDKANKVKESLRNGLDTTDPNGNWGRLSLGRINAKKALDYYCY